MKKEMNREEKTRVLGKGDEKVITLDNAIQCYSTFYLEMAPIAKLNKSKLYDATNLKLILGSVEAERVILAVELYRGIMSHVRDYRRYRRSDEHKIILSYLGITAEQIDEYSFLNTADIFLLSGVAETCRSKYGKIPDLNDDSKFKDWSFKARSDFENNLKFAIDVFKCEVAKHEDTPVYNLTKQADFHNSYIKKIKTSIKSKKINTK